METLYDILEVSKKASKEVIEKAYRTLAKKYHPDLQEEKDRAYAEEKMKKINEAYDILSNEEKRNEYDRELEEQEERIARMNNEYNVSYTNSNQNDMYNQTGNTVNSSYSNNENDWRSQYANLNKKEQQKVIKNIQKEANEEYRRQYENYFRSLGFKIKHRWTLKDFLVIGLVILSLIVIFFILWLIPPTHKWLLQLYNENFLIKIIVNIFIGICQGVVKFFQNITKF